MQYTIEDIRRLVPEADRFDCPDKPAGHVYWMMDEHGQKWVVHHADPFWLALLTTRAQLEVAVEAINDAVGTANGREDEWGDRAVDSFRYLYSALAKIEFMNQNR